MEGNIWRKQPCVCVLVQMYVRMGGDCISQCEAVRDSACAAMLDAYSVRAAEGGRGGACGERINGFGGDCHDLYSTIDAGLSAMRKATATVVKAELTITEICC